VAPLRIGTRGSQLALWQANHVADLLRRLGHSAELQIIKTTGDKMQNVSLSKIGIKGMFTKEIEEALAAREVDLAVHSLKDLPTEIDSRFTLTAILPREDARDGFVSVHYRSIEELPSGARVGTSSLRRQAQLIALRPDLDLQPLRGNVDTRLHKLESGEYAAIILAAAGLRRLGLTTHLQQMVPIEQMCPAPGQGALAIEARADDAATCNILQSLDDSSTRAAVTSERATLHALGGGCQVPIGVHAEVAADVLRVHAIVASPNGQQILRESGKGSIAAAEKLGKTVAQQLLNRGAAQILKMLDVASLLVPEQP
jgi:hydroxymethylbilane synthase